jgi:hypothetical protein
VILIGSAILFALGIALLLWQVIVLAYRLTRLAVLLIALCGSVLAVVVTGCAWLVMKVAQYIKGQEPEPVVTISFYADADDVMELPRSNYRRLRG